MSDAQQPHLNQSDIPFGDAGPGGPPASPAEPGRYGAAKAWLGRYRRTLSNCLACLLLFGCVRFAGLFVVLFVMGYAPWLVFSLLVIRFRQDRREWQATRLALWTVTLLASIGFVVYWNYDYRAFADSTVAGIERFREVYGRYPHKLAEAGIADSEARSHLIFYYYGNDQDGPSLMRRQFMDAFDSCSYNFPVRTWVCDGDD